MKITKRQLRRIIKEEKIRFLKEEEDSFARARRSFKGEESVTDLLGDLHDAIDALLRAMEPIELADELRGIASDLDREDDRRFAQMRDGQ